MDNILPWLNVLWAVLPSALIIIAVWRYARRRQAAGRGPVQLIWDTLVVFVVTTGGAVLATWLVTSWALPGIERSFESGADKSQAGRVIFLASRGQWETLLEENSSHKELSPWAATPTQPAANGSVPTPTPATTEVVYPAFSTGLGFDACGYRRMASGAWGLIVCDQADLPTGETRAIPADELPSGAPQPPAGTSTTGATQPPTMVDALLFTQDESIAECFFRHLAENPAFLQSAGIYALPAGSRWELVNDQATFFKSSEKEVWSVCSLNWPELGCVVTDGNGAKKLGGAKKGLVITGASGQLPAACAPSSSQP